MTKIQDFETNHYDRITVVDHDLTGKRLLTASADHRVKVYERATADSDPVLKDTWTAHNADIRDVSRRNIFQPIFRSMADSSGPGKMVPSNLGYPYRDHLKRLDPQDLGA